MSKTTSWGIFKGQHNGHGIYWSGTYNVEGHGYFATMQEAREYADAINRSHAEKARAEAEAKVQAGAIRCERNGDNVTVHLPEGAVTIPVRVYRQNVFDWETKYGKEFVWA